MLGTRTEVGGKQLADAEDAAAVEELAAAASAAYHALCRLQVAGAWWLSQCELVGR